MHDLDLLIIYHQLHVLYPTRFGCKENLGPLYTQAKGSDYRRLLATAWAQNNYF